MHQHRENAGAAAERQSGIERIARSHTARDYAKDRKNEPKSDHSAHDATISHDLQVVIVRLRNSQGSVTLCVSREGSLVRAESYSKHRIRANHRKGVAPNPPATGEEGFR